jgi:hypothetical protein
VVIAIVEIVAILVYIYNNYWNCRIPNMLVALESAFISLLTLLLLIFPNIIISVLVTVTAIIISGCFAIKKLPLQCKKIIEIIKRKNIEKRNKEKRKKQIAEKFGASNEDVDKLLLQIDKMNKINSELGNSETVWDELKFTLESNPRCISKVQRFFDLYVTDMLEIFEISKSSTTVSEEKLISVINLTSKCAKILIDDINQTNVNSVHSKLEMLENRLNNDLNSRI